MSQKGGSLWNIKDIIILQFTAWGTWALADWSRKLLISDSHPLSPLFNGLFYFIGHFMILGVLVYWSLYCYDLTPDFFGLSWRHFTRGVILALKLALPLLIMVLVVINIPLGKGDWANFTPLFSLGEGQNFSLSLFYLLGFFMFFLVPRAAMELLYRGFLGLFLAGKCGRIFGGVFCAIFYAFLAGPWHLEWVALNCIMGMVLYHVFYSKKSLWPGIIYSALVYSIMVVYIFGWNYLT